jgi:hypothetical protein
MLPHVRVVRILHLARMLGLVTATASLAAACGASDTGAAGATLPGVTSGSAGTWIAPFPSPVELGWMKGSTDCGFGETECEQFVPFFIASVTCDDCTVLAEAPTSFSFVPFVPGTATDPPFYEPTLIYVVPQSAGPAKLHATLQSIDGDTQTVEADGDGDVVTGLVASCEQIAYTDPDPYQAPVEHATPCGPRLSIGADAVIWLHYTLQTLGTVDLDQMFQGTLGGTIGGFEDYANLLPTMEPDAASWQGFGETLLPQHAASLETLTLTVNGAPLTATVAVPPPEQ